MAEKQITKFIVADQISKLSDLAIGHQQIIFVKDKQKIALDYNGERIFYNHIEILQTENERKELTTQKNGIFYFVVGTASLWFYNEKWIRVTAPPKEIVFIGTSFPELGSENTLYVNKKNGEECISVWDVETQSYIFIAGKTKAISSSKIDELFLFN
jgi:hypothetical protein